MIRHYAIESDPINIRFCNDNIHKMLVKKWKKSQRGEDETPNIFEVN